MAMEPPDQVRQTFMDFMHQKPQQRSLSPPCEASTRAVSVTSSSVVMLNDGSLRLQNDELQAHSSSNPCEISAKSEPTLEAHDYIGLTEVSSASSSVSENECVSDAEDTDLRLTLGPPKDEHSMHLRLPRVELELFTPKESSGTAVHGLHQMSANVLMPWGAVPPHKNGCKRAFGEALSDARPGVSVTPSALTQCQGTGQSKNQQIAFKPSLTASKCTCVYPTLEAVDRLQKSERYNSALEELPPAKGQVVGWPPIRTYRRNILMVSHTQPSEDGEEHATLYVKVNMDGVPVGRKVDLNVYSSYESLVAALEEMFYNPNNGDFAHFLTNGMFALTYEDKEGDWMLVGDVPWGMFIDSVRRLRIVRTSESIGLGPRR